MSVSDRLNELSITLPSSAKPLASYVPAVRAGTFVYTSGQLPTVEGELVCRGLVGADVSETEAHDAARVAMLNALAAVTSVASLDDIEQVVHVTGYVACAPSFTNQPAVVNGASQLLLDIFGNAGRHSRAAVGVASLPLGAPVEIDLTVSLKG
jgi:enamine deaminase RidA (YjgF/YER057c/UK114 family)